MHTEFSRPTFQPLRNRILACLLFVATGLQGCSDNSPARNQPDELFPIADLARLEALGQESTGAHGKTVLINFWATWCAPCRREMPELQQLDDSLPGERFAVIGVSVDSDGHLAREFLRDNRIRFANYLDPQQLLAADLLGIQNYPQTFVVAPNGRILLHVTGERSWNISAFEELLHGNGMDDPRATGG